MATAYSANARLQKPGTSDRQWDVPINANTDALDAMTAVGALVATTTETPSSTLQIRVAPGAFVLANGTVGTFAGAPAVTVAASATTYLWLDATGALATGPAFPASAHLRIARVVAGPAAVILVVDERVQCRMAGTSPSYVLKAGDTITGLLTISAPASTGATVPVVVADPANHAIGFFGANPATQAPAVAPIVAAPGSAASDTLADVGAAFAPATLNNNFASLATKVDAILAALKRHGLMAN